MSGSQDQNDPENRNGRVAAEGVWWAMNLGAEQSGSVYLSDRSCPKPADHIPRRTKARRI